MSQTSSKNTSQIKLENELAKNVSELSKQVADIKNMEVIRILRRPFRLMWLSFLKGLMVGFGSVLGASVLVAIFIFILSKMSLVPYIGDQFQSIIDQLQLKQNTESEVPAKEAPVEEIKADEVNVQTEQVNIQEEATIN
ncbi:MAG: DUF5665 domain-containing protein [Patescibacteria group bacterium]